MINEFNIHSDYHTQAYFAFMSANRWFAIRLDSVVLVYSIVVVYGCIFLKGKKSNSRNRSIIKINLIKIH